MPFRFPRVPDRRLSGLLPRPVLRSEADEQMYLTGILQPKGLSGPCSTLLLRQKHFHWRKSYSHVFPPHDQERVEHRGQREARMLRTLGKGQEYQWAHALDRQTQTGVPQCSRRAGIPVGLALPDTFATKILKVCGQSALPLGLDNRVPTLRSLREEPAWSPGPAPDSK